MSGFKSSKGFTIVELLIVVVVIAILAAITIVSYNGITNQAHDATVQSDLRDSFQKASQFKIKHASNRYPNTGSEYNAEFTTTRSAYETGSNALIYCFNGTEAGLAGRSRSGNGFGYSSVKGAVSFESWPGDSNVQLCPALGIDTGSTGYGNNWFYANGEWATWYSPGR